MPFSGSTQRWKTPVTLRLTSSRFTIVYAPARRWTCLAEISSVGNSLFTKKLRMGWAHDGAVTSSIVRTATVTRAGGLGGEELELATACCIDAVPGPAVVAPGLSSEDPGQGATMAVPGRLSKSPSRLLGSPSRIRLRRGQAARRWNQILETA